MSFYSNNELSSDEIANLINKFPSGDGDNGKAYFVLIRAFVIIRRSLKNLIVESLPLTSDVGNEELANSESTPILSRAQFNAFVDETIFQSLRYPPLPLPQNRDEIM